MAESRIPGAERGPQVTFEIDGQPILAHRGETVAMALFAAGHATIRHSAQLAAPRGIYCNMGACYECLVYVVGDDGAKSAVRACMHLVEAGMRLATWRPESDSLGRGGIAGSAGT